MVGVRFDIFVAFGCNDDGLAAACADLFDIAHNLVVLGAGGCDEDGGHSVGDEGDWAVLHLGGGEALGVDVAYFLQFEGAFEGDGVIEPSAEE